MADDTKPRVYIAGPMSGIEAFNYPAFHVAAARLRQLGYHVENPAENPAPPCGSWTRYLRMAIAQVVKCDAMALLPGWDKSRGAQIECRLAYELGFKKIDSVEAFEGGN